jgi:hypothetical protein
LKPEKTRIRGKKVFDITFDSSMNDIFVKESKTGKRAYYPASMEYGFMKKDGGYVPGFHFLRNALTENKSAIESKVVGILGKKIDQELKKKG